MSDRLPKIDAYIAGNQPFARPILTHLRECLHRAVPEVEEAMKWSRPFFLYRGVILGNIAAFKQHCSFGLWGHEMAETLRTAGLGSGEGMGTFGRIAALADLPPAPQLESLIRHAADLIETGTRTKSIQRVAKPARVPVEIPAQLQAALDRHPAAAARFAVLSPSCRREYTEWIAGAKREETIARRVATALEWIAAGKSRNWKHEPPTAAQRAT